MQNALDNFVESADLLPGVYVLAISGGVDSMTLLNVMAKVEKANKNIKFVVAHYDHGIRPDSYFDRKLVERTARQHGLPFVYAEGSLGPGASETEAREARYSFLEQTRKASGARAIITAHHQDDAIETAIINLRRGTGRRGITALGHHPHMQRPLLALSKAELQQFASEQGLVWNEDSTNNDIAILRNYIRSKLSTLRSDPRYPKLVEAVKTMRRVNKELDELLEVYLHSQDGRHLLNRVQFLGLPYDLAKEVLAQWLRSGGFTTFNSTTLGDLVVKCKTLSAGKSIDLDNFNKIEIRKDNLALVTRER